MIFFKVNFLIHQFQITIEYSYTVHHRELSKYSCTPQITVNRLYVVQQKNSNKKCTQPSINRMINDNHWQLLLYI